MRLKVALIALVGGLLAIGSAGQGVFAADKGGNRVRLKLQGEDYKCSAYGHPGLWQCSPHF